MQNRNILTRKINNAEQEDMNIHPPVIELAVPVKFWTEDIIIVYYGNIILFLTK